MSKNSPTVPEALSEIIQVNPTIQFALHHKLLNLSQLAQFLLPSVRARLEKPVTSTSILMALSRLHRNLPKAARSRQQKFRLDSLNVHPNLCIVTVQKSKDARRCVNALYARLQRDASYVTLTEGLEQITIIFDGKFRRVALQAFGKEVQNEYQNIAALSGRFSSQYLETPGFLYLVLQQMAVQGINILELASTANEIILYIAKKDVQLAFETLYGRFLG